LAVLINLNESRYASADIKRLLQEVEADYLLFEFTKFKGEKGFEFVPFENGKNDAEL